MGRKILFQFASALCALVVILGLCFYILFLAADPKPCHYVMQTEQDIVALEQNVEAWRTHTGALPTTAELHAAIGEGGAQAEGQTIRLQWFKDFWGRPYEYLHERGQTEYRIRTLGRDGEPGGTLTDRDFDREADWIGALTECTDTWDGRMKWIRYGVPLLLLVAAFNWWLLRTRQKQFE